MKFKKKLVLPLAVLLTCAAPLYAFECGHGQPSRFITTKNIGYTTHMHDGKRCVITTFEIYEGVRCNICSTTLAEPRYKGTSTSHDY